MKKEDDKPKPLVVHQPDGKPSQKVMKLLVQDLAENHQPVSQFDAYFRPPPADREALFGKTSLQVRANKLFPDDEPLLKRVAIHTLKRDEKELLAFIEKNRYHPDPNTPKDMRWYEEQMALNRKKEMLPFDLTQKISIEMAEDRLDLTQKCLNLLENGKKPSAWDAVPDFALGVIDWIAPEEAFLMQLKGLIKNQKVADSVKHIEDPVLRTDEYYKRTYQNMHLNDGFTQNRTMKAGILPDTVKGLDMVNEQNIWQKPLIGTSAPPLLGNPPLLKQVMEQLKSHQDSPDIPAPAPKFKP